MLAKRENFRAAFADFDFQRIAGFGDHRPFELRPRCVVHMNRDGTAPRNGQTTRMNHTGAGRCNFLGLVKAQSPQ